MQRDPIRRGDVFLVVYAFPHKDEGSEKQRPILVLENDEDNQNVYYPFVQAAPITTQKTERIYEQDVLLPSGEANLQRTSKILLGLTQPFLKTRLGQKVGHISPSKMREVEVKRLRLFGFVAKRQ